MESEGEYSDENFEPILIEECLPFAIEDTSNHNNDDSNNNNNNNSSSICQPQHWEGLKRLLLENPPPDYCSSSSIYSSTSAPPRLAASSVTSDTHTEGDHSSIFGSHTLSQFGSQYLDTAASLFAAQHSLLQLESSTLAASSLNRSSSWQHPPNSSNNSSNNSTDVPNHSSSYSPIEQQQQQLHVRTTSTERRLPVLPEESSVADSHYRSPHTSFLVEDEPHPNSPSWTLERTIVPAVVDSLHMSEPRRLAHLAGATVTTLGDRAFRVSIEVSAPGGVSQVLHVLSQPHVLAQWCDPVESLVVVRTSGSNSSSLSGSDNTTLPSRSTNNIITAQLRAPADEWIEATTCAPLVVPRTTSCIVRAHSALATLLGFPTYGKVHMFVERTRGRVGITLGPFPGNVQVVHQLVVEEEQLPLVGRWRIVNQVRLQPYGTTSDIGTSSYCGVWDVLERCFLPTVDDYMDQVLSSMARLRFLIEQQQQQGESPVAMHSGSDTDSLRTPLLS
jgi:hypothetical protein